MAPLPSRKSLESLKRVELQNLCKEYGVRANLKSEALIELLLETQSAPAPSPMRRSVSTTRPPSRAGPSRTTSLIIHDVEEEEKEPDMGTISEEPASVLEEEPAEVQPPPESIRTRKAKDLQTRLGVGRPKAAGGSGPRAVTKSMSVPRGRRGKSSRMLSKVEATIEEEAEPSSSGATRMQSEQPSQVDTPNIPLIPPSTTPSNEVAEQIANAIRPLQVKVESLEERLRNTLQQNEELELIKIQLANLETLQQRYDALEAEVRQLRAEAVSIASLSEEFRHFKETMGTRTSPPPMLPSTPKPKSPRLQLPGGLGMGFPSAFKTMSFPPSMATPSPTEALKGEVSNQPPGESTTTLGKRPRTSTESNISGVAEEDREGDLSDQALERTVFRPNKKRPKLSNIEDHGSVAGPSKQSTIEVAAQLLAPRLPSFTIFQGPETDYSSQYLSDINAPPTNPLPEVYRPPTPPGGSFLPAPRTGHRAISSASNEENQQHPFDFSFFPSNGHESFMEPIPFPEPPQSPSPASHTIGFMSQIQADRTDPFKEFGFPSPRRPRQSSTTGESSREASGKQREITSNEVAAGLGLTMVRTGSPGLPDAPPSKKTMYGTELEGETRFGDFGVEGVASGFWSSR